MVPPVDNIDFLDAINMETFFDLDGSDSSTGLLVSPTTQDLLIPQTLDPPAILPLPDLPDLLRSELYVSNSVL